MALAVDLGVARERTLGGGRDWERELRCRAGVAESIPVVVWPSQNVRYALKSCEFLSGEGCQRTRIEMSFELALGWVEQLKHSKS